MYYNVPPIALSGLWSFLLIVCVSIDFNNLVFADVGI